MSLPHRFEDLARRLQEVRSWASDVTDGNRCAMVLGLALGVKPSRSQATMRGQPFVAEAVRNQPFTEKFFVKAWDLTESVLKTWGPPSKRINGTQAAKDLGSMRGFVFLEDCWKTPTEKMNKMLFGVHQQTGDHVDLWNGSALAIYPKRMESLALLGQSRNVWLWGCKE